MDKRANIAGALAAMLRQRPGKEAFFTAQVLSVEGLSCTIDYDGLTIDGVRLLPTTAGESDKVLTIPKVGAYVLVGCAGDLGDLWVVHTDAVDRLEISCGGQNLLLAITSLIDALSGTITLTTTQGPGTGNFAPDTVAKLKEVENAFKQIFK